MMLANTIFNKLTEVFGPYMKKKIQKRRLVAKDKLNKTNLEVEKQAKVLEKYEVQEQLCSFYNR